MIDWTRVDELRNEIGQEEFLEVVELFLCEVEEVIGRLRTRPDPSRYAEDLHFLKGSALNLGFDAFGALCQEGERAVASGGSVDIAATLRLYEASKIEFLRGRSEID
jgi:histidine phosphotransfer protein HptB